MHGEKTFITCGSKYIMNAPLEKFVIPNRKNEITTSKYINRKTISFEINLYKKRL